MNNSDFNLQYKPMNLKLDKIVKNPLFEQIAHNISQRKSGNNSYITTYRKSVASQGSKVTNKTAIKSSNEH